MFVPAGVIPAVSCRSTRTCRSTKRRTARTCATWPRSKGSPPSPSMPMPPKSPRAPSTSSAACSRSPGGIRSCRSSTASTPKAASRRSALRRWPRGRRSALLVFPPGIYTFGQRPEMALEHFQRIADATDLPLILFQYPLAGGQGYPMSTLVSICDEVPRVRRSRTGARTRCCTSGTSAPAAVAPAAGQRAHHAQLVAFSARSCSGCNGSAFRQRLGHRGFAGTAFPFGSRAGSGKGKSDPRAHQSDRRSVLRRAVRRHAQPDEGSARAPRPAAARRGAPAARQAFSPRKSSASAPRWSPQGCFKNNPSQRRVA